MNLLEHAALFVSGLIAGSYSTLVGGGTLLTVPVLLLLGVPPHTAVATNRVGVLGLSITGWVAFQQQGLIRHTVSSIIGIACGAGAVAGAMVFLNLSDVVLQRIIGAVGLGLLFFTALQKDAGIQSPGFCHPRRWIAGIPAAFILGAYGSIYGAGLGTFLTYLLVFVFGQTFLESAGTRKFALGLQSLVASALYWRAGLIDWPSAANLFISMGIGSYIGARYGTKLGNLWIRRLFLTVAAVLTLKAVL